MNQWSPLLHRIYRLMSQQKMQGSQLLLAVSGGADSMALMLILNDLKSALNLDLEVAHIHHGPGRWLAYRDRAEKVVKEATLQLGLPLVGKRSELELKSEQELRNFRRNSLRELSRDRWILTAHHLQDLVETRMIRLVRGTGPQGLAAIRVKRRPWFRPFLTTTRAELRQELASRNSSFWEDPSNKDLGPLRNWVRHEWLPALEQKRPGSLQSLGRSLEILARSQDLPLENAIRAVWVNNSTLSRGFFHTLDDNQKQQVLAQCLYRVVGLNYSSGQIKEIQKRLDNPKKEHTFVMKNSLWVINAEQISVKKKVR
jgi:tRNA(Ile)-lysidine synthase